MKYWKKLTSKQIRDIVFAALDKNVNFENDLSIGIPASHLDSKVFFSQAPFLEDAPFMNTLVHNPNHIGCHTVGESEEFFEGTHDIEREAIKILAEDLLGGGEDEQDGYIASGGTEANIQACWIYRNYFKVERKAKHKEIALLCSEDTHYSIPKASNLLNISKFTVPVIENTREITPEAVANSIELAKSKGKKYFIVVANMATTMFGSVDNPQIYIDALKAAGVEYKLHIDGAYGGFIYPVTSSNKSLSFANPEVSSITIDAHKMLQAPYGTGIFLARKGLIGYVLTKEAQYVSGMDLTLIGSRSGANAIAVWMILMTYGPYGWLEKMQTLIYRTDRLCNELDKKQIKYFREKDMNIVTIFSDQISAELANKYGLVPETHDGNNKWWKIVIMDHVDLNILMQFVNEI
ncbi:MAG: aspartate aminotransferase family protein [Ignavibacteriae bacterium HGW-Ignavibacteriae-4]|jgi:glutamate/tyrosine decarboxylase-like PLP-dependent enzyme|nr:MAG: aspartate aminotransferase family protein [Ignavibacteriae bacterium HGW-Ignavibacteriae-4]